MNPIDTHIAGKVKALRIFRGKSQEWLAARCGVRYQQLQRYEKGTNRISASRLWQICKALETDVGFFFIGLP